MNKRYKEIINEDKVFDEKISNAFDGITFSEEQKKSVYMRLEEVDEEKCMNVKQENAKENNRTNEVRRNRNAILSACACVIIAVSLISAVIINGNKNEKMKAEEKLNDSIAGCNQSIVIDDYKISLLSETYDEKNKNGYCEFEIIKNNGNDKIELEKLESSNGFFLNRFQFLFDINGSVVCNISYKKNGNVVKMFVDLSVSAEKYDGRMYIFDYDSGKDSGVDECEGYFELTNTLEAIEFVSEDGTIINVSPLSIQVVETNSINEGDISIIINYKDKESVSVVEHGKLSDLVKRDSNSYIDNIEKNFLKYDFKKEIDVEHIESVSYNEETVTESKGK